MHCFHCRKEDYSLPLIRSHSLYQGTVKKLIHGFKYRQKEYLEYDCSQLLLNAWLSYPELKLCEWIVPVPLHPSSLRERGYNQSERLAFHLAKRVESLTFISNALIRRKRTQSQTTLTRTERIKNVESVFRVCTPESIAKKNILLIDDVCTTGATLRECSKTLKKAGAKNVCCLTIARD